MGGNANPEWGPWRRHLGGDMPVSNGTVVEVITLVRTKDGVNRKVGVAGKDLRVSWGWTPENRDTYPAAPIDFYRVKKPKGLALLERLLEERPELEDA